MSLGTELEELLGERVGRLTQWGGPDVPVASPADADELARVLELARVDGLRVLPIGNGSKLDWALVPQRVDLAVSTRRMTGILQHEPAEGVVTARAGTTMRELARHVARGALHLSPDVARGDRATLGGVVSAAQSGCDRLRSGPVRDQVLGVELVLADGRRVRSGGALVKDVAGYDLHRLVCGAHGLLGVVTQVSLRLAPLHPARILVRRRFEDFAAGHETLIEVARLVPRARALRLDGPPDRIWATVDLDGRDEVAADELQRVLGVFGDSHVLRDEPARRVAHDLRELERRAGRWAPLEIDTLPSRLPALWQDCARLLGSVRWRAELHPALGLLRLHVDGELERGTALALGSAVHTHGAIARWRGLAPALRDELALARGEPAGLQLMQRLRAALDPESLLAAPRIHPEL